MNFSEITAHGLHGYSGHKKYLLLIPELRSPNGLFSVEVHLPRLFPSDIILFFILCQQKVIFANPKNYRDLRAKTGNLDFLTHGHTSADQIALADLQ
jgi:hypothetical protein